MLGYTCSGASLQEGFDLLVHQRVALDARQQVDQQQALVSRVAGQRERLPVQPTEVVLASAVLSPLHAVVLEYTPGGVVVQHSVDRVQDIGGRGVLVEAEVSRDTRPGTLRRR